MEPAVTKRDLFKKYAKILQINNETKLSPKMVYPPQPNSAKTSGHVESAQKYLQLKSRSGHLSPKPEMSSTSLKFHVSRLRGSPGRPDTSLTGLSSPKLFGSSSEHRLTTSSYIVEEANSEEIRPTPSKSASKFDWSDFNNPKKFELREIKERSVLATASSMAKSRREYYPYGEKPLTLEDLYTDAKDVGEELKTIIAQEHEETIKGLMKHLNVREFMKIQKSRIENVLKVVEKGFVQKVAKENKVKQETWNVISAELNEVRSVYEEFLLTLEGEYDKAIKGKKKMDDSLVPWEALRMLIEYSPLYRASKNEPSQGAQSKLDDLFRAIHRFKVEYRISRDFKPKVLEIYGQVEAHIKSLNELIDNERAKAAGIVQQRKQLLQERKEIEEKNDKLKNEMMETIKEWKMGGAHTQKHNLPAFQEKFLQGKIDQLQAEFDKAASDNTQLIKDLKETRQEVRRLAYREDRMSKNCKDKAIMVDLYTKESLGPPTILMTNYLTDIELCKDGSELPKELINSLMSLIYSDKMISDLCDDHDMRPRRSLGAYLPEWFLKKFGVYGFSEMLLRDFMCNVNNIAKNSDKFKVFRELVGVEAYSGLDNFKYMLDGHNKPEKTRLKKIAFCTAEMSRQFNRVINCVKHHWQLEIDSPVHSHNHGPYLPNIPPKKEYISNETIKSVLLAIITEEKFNDNEVKDIEEFLFLTQQAEAYNRELNMKVTTNDEPEAPPSGMKFDLFVKFLLEIILQKHMEKLEVYYTTFKAKMAAVKQKALSFEEYKQTIEHIDPEASQSWKEHSYAQLMNQYSSQKVPLLKLMENFIKCYFKEDQAKEIHHKPHHEKYKKKETSSLKIGKNNSSKQNSSTKKHQKHTEQNDSNSVKPRLLESAKEAFGLGESYLNEQGYELYDAISSLVVLQETYYMVEERVTLIEKTTDGLLGAHDDFSKSLALLPKKVSKLDKYDSLVIFSKEELVDFVEQLWIKFRIILSLAFRSK